MTTQERNAWATVYKIYDEYAPQLRKAAKANDTDLAGSISLTICNRLEPIFNASDEGGRLILLAVHDILTNVYKASKNGLSGR